MNREEAFELLKKYNKEEFHIHHGETVEGVMRYFAEKLGYGDEVEFWGMVGLLHDIDFEMWPEEHCVKACLLYTSPLRQRRQRQSQNKKSRLPAGVIFSRLYLGRLL